MASLIEELIDILDQECEIYQQLLPIAMEKTQVIVRNDTVALQEITGKEQEQVDKVNNLEHKRDDVMTNIKTVIGKKSGTLNLTSLIQLLDKQPKEQKTLSVLHDRLNDTVHSLIEVNDRNKTLIQQSLEMIEFNMNFIQSTRMSPGNNTYTKGASSSDAQAYGTGMFDAKQ
ncbi:MAG TPA: flagellar protein FlgN [Mobilitalea sp.]|nr:flagellar protein FlgN [Mobilitalea sp.]